MKSTIIPKIRASIFTLLAVLLGLWARAQDQSGGSGGSSVSVSTTHSANSADNGVVVQPWMWIVGVAAFVLILVAIISAGRGRAKE